MADARGRDRGSQRRRFEAGRAQDGEARRRIPAGELRIEGAPVVSAHVEAVFTAERAHGCEHDIVCVHEPACRPAASLHLDDGRRRRACRVGELIRK